MGPCQGETLIQWENMTIPCINFGQGARQGTLEGEEFMDGKSMIEKPGRRFGPGAAKGYYDEYTVG